MIHRIKALHDNGDGLSIRAIEKELGVSRNTIRKYLRMSEGDVLVTKVDTSRRRRLDPYRPYIEYLLERFPRLSNVKLARKISMKFGEMPVSQRSLRRYVRLLKEAGVFAQPRYYEPVLDMVPGVQCQVDPGAMRGVMIGGVPQTVYFVVFVLSYSRLMHVGLSLKPIDTECFIRLHDQAMQYFGGVPEECVYDQTKLVVLAESFRELSLNEQFHGYTCGAGFNIHVCRGYDPESKGKVEAGVKYVKNNALYAESFADEADLKRYMQNWVNDVANVRWHGTTGRQPIEHFESEERAHLRAYHTPAVVSRAGDAVEQRGVDKTGLISYHANKYSVPMRYQRGRVGVHVEGTELVISDLNTGEAVASHLLETGKGVTVRQNDHYRDYSAELRRLEAEVASLAGAGVGPALCAQLKASMPRYYRDQLLGARRYLRAAEAPREELLAQLAKRPGLTASLLRDYLEADSAAATRGRDAPTDEPSSDKPVRLSAYAQLASAAEASHEPA